MNKILSLVTVLFLAFNLSGQGDAIDRFFGAYENNEEFTVVYVSPKMFKMVSKVTEGQKDGDITELIKDIKGLKILSTDKDGLKYYAEAIKKIPTSEYDVLLTVKDKGENVKFLTKGTDDSVSELLLLVGGADNFTLMSFVGNLDLKKIAKLANKLDIEGSEYLDKLKDKK